MKEKEKENQIDVEFYLDPVFRSVGQRVFSYELIQKLRKQNLEKKSRGRRIFNMIPQAGFQEQVMLADADIQIIGGKRGGGKAVSVDSTIVTPFGLRRYGDLKIGDIVTDPCTGGMEKVIGIYEHPQKDLYELQFDDDTTCECCLDHLWKVRQTRYSHKRRRLYGLGLEDDYRIWTFAMIKNWLDKQESGMYMDRKTKSISKKHLVIPLTEPVKFTKTGICMKRNDLDPYVIGAILGDGCITKKATKCYDAQFCTDDNEIEMQFINAGIDMSKSRTRKGGSETFKQYCIKNEKLGEMLELCKLKGCYSINKFIPYRYKFASIEERFAIIQGLMDTDGYVDGRGRCYFNTISEQLAKDVQFVIQSLGGWAKISKKKAGYKKDGEYVECNDVYELYIRIKNPHNLFRLKRKKERCTEFNGGISEITKRIVGYRYIGKKDARCIRVDSPNSLYAIQGFIVTHNTFIGLFKFLPYIFNSDVYGYGFRKLEGDVDRGIYKSSKQVFKGFGSSADSSWTWKFLNGKGATMQMDHLQDPKKIMDRFRGVEMAYILIEELAEHTREDMNVLFDLLTSNRSTAGCKPQFVCTCNPVGKSNKLRTFLDWYIDPETDTIIPERDGKVRYFHRINDSDIVWGNSYEEVYNNPSVKKKIDTLCQDTGGKYQEFITSVVFIEGNYNENQILRASDPKYMNRISARGGESTANDISGVWRDIETGANLLTLEDMEKFFNNTERKGDEVMRASCDVALTGDFFVIWAFCGNHICDMEAWRGVPSDEVIPFIENFLNKNGVRKDNFTFDANGLGLWIEQSKRFAQSKPFNNKSAASDNRLWGNLKSEAAEKFVKAIKHKEFSIDDRILERQYTDKKGWTFKVRDRLLEERKALKRKDDVARFDIIAKPQMKLEVGWSPDFIEGLMMVMPLLSSKQNFIRKGFNYFSK